MNTLGYLGILWDTLGHPRSPLRVPKGSQRGPTGCSWKVVLQGLISKLFRIILGVHGHPLGHLGHLGPSGDPGGLRSPTRKKNQILFFLLYTLCAKENVQKNFPIVTYCELGLSLRSVCEEGLNMSSLSTEFAYVPESLQTKYHRPCQLTYAWNICT